MNPAEFSIKNRLISFIVIFGCLIAGWLAYEKMPRFEDPEFSIRTAQIITTYPGATPEEVANEVSDVLESAVQQLQEVEEVRSTSSNGLSIIAVDVKYEFSPNKQDLQGIWAKLRNKVSDAAANLPPGAGVPLVNDDFGDVFGMFYLLTGQGFSSKEMEDYAESLRTELLKVDNVAKVNIIGNQREVIYLEVARERANAMGVSLEQVYQQLSTQNMVYPAGKVAVGDFRMVIQSMGAPDSVDALRNMVISTNQDGPVVYLGDIATIERGYQDPPKLVMEYDGQQALGIGVSNVQGANVAQLGEDVNAKLRELSSEMPLGMELHEFYHQGKVVTVAVKDFAVNVVAALLIVLVTLLIFMGLRSAVIIGALLMITIAATLATMNFIGIPMHRISLGALIIALGMLVDNAIVVTEGILVGIQQGSKKLDISKLIVKRTSWPLLGGTIVGILAFAPIGLAPGSTAEFTGHLFWVVMISLFYSWVFAITAVPLLADLLFPEPEEGKAAPQEGRFSQVYKKFMAVVLNLRFPVIAGCVLLLMLSLWGAQWIKPGFFPASTTPQLVVDFWLPEGSDIHHTHQQMESLTDKVAAMEGVENVLTLSGGGAMRYMLVYSPENPNSAYGQLLVRLSDYSLGGRLMPEIQSLIDREFPNAQGKVWRFQLGPGGGSKIEAEFSGPNPDVLRDLANQAKAIMAADGRALSIKDDWRQPVPVIRPIYNEVQGRRLGISRQDIANALNTTYSGRNIGVYREGEDLIPIISRSPVEQRHSPDAMGEILVTSPVTGAMVPMIEVVDRFDLEWTNGVLMRVDRVWTIKAQCDPMPDEFASTLLSRIQSQIEAIELPPGYSLEWGGEKGDSEEANSNLASALPMGFLAMVLTVVLLFNAIRQPLIIWLVVPLAMIGVVIGLVATGTPMEFMAILGVLSLSGLLIKNAIVLVDQMDLEIREQKPRFDAVIDSATSRVRPVMMGALTTVLGVLPLFGDPFFKSMAVVLVFGLTFATLLTLVVVPALYAAFFKIRSDETAKPS